MERNDILEQIALDINASEMLLIGLGKEMECQTLEWLDELAEFLKQKNYFVLTTCENLCLEQSKLNPIRVFNITKIEEDENAQKQWELYNKWLSATLNKALLMIELGESFNRPELIRWPFEKVTFINDKAKLYSVNSKFPQIPENIKNKAFPVKENAVIFIQKVIDYESGSPSAQ